MKNFFYNLWNKFKTQPDIRFFFVFLLTFSLSIRKVLFYFPIQGTFNEYSGIYVYISDIALILTLILWLISILCNNKLSLSSIKLWIKHALKNKYLIIPIFFTFISFLSILWSENKSIAFFRSIKLFEFYLLYIYIIFRISPKLFHVEQFWEGGTFSLFSLIIIFLGFFQGIVGIIQFIIQESIGLFWLHESLISPEILGVAKIILNREVYIRAYGLMPHPNILGGFLLFSIIITLLYKKLLYACPLENFSTPARSENVPCLSARKLFHVEQFWEDGTISDGWNNLGRVEQFQLKNKWILNIALFIQIIALFLTFSKSAIIGLVIALSYIYWNKLKLFHTCPPKNCFTPARQKNVPCGTFLGGWNNFGRVEHFRVFFLSGLIILVFLFLIFKPDPSSLFFSSLKERVFYLNVPRGTFTQDPFLGVGAGQSVLVMQKFYPQNLEFWEYQPVHNVFLLILSELGSVGLILFIWWLYKLFQKIPHPNPLLRKERERIVPRGTSHSSSPYQGEELKEGLKERERKNRSNILSNNNIYLSSIIASQYFKGILLGFIFIMLFDHYLWDIQQGSLLLWIVAGFVAGINKIKQEIK